MCKRSNEEKDNTINCEVCNRPATTTGAYGVGDFCDYHGLEDRKKAL